MSESTLCARCKEPIEGEPVEKAGKKFCSEACAYEATQRPAPKMCGTLPTSSNRQPKS